MPLNVLGIGRFASPNEQNRRFCRAGKLWVEGGVGMAKPWPSNTEPRAADRRRSVYHLL